MPPKLTILATFLVGGEAKGARPVLVCFFFRRKSCFYFWLTKIVTFTHKNSNFQLTKIVTFLEFAFTCNGVIFLPVTSTVYKVYSSWLLLPALKTGTMGTLASQAEIGVWVQWSGMLLWASGVLPSEICKILQCGAFLDEKMVRNAGNNAFLNTLTMGTAFPRVSPRNGPWAEPIPAKSGDPVMGPLIVGLSCQVEFDLNGARKHVTTLFNMKTYNADHVVQPPSLISCVKQLQSETETPPETAHRQIWRQKLCWKKTASKRILAAAFYICTSSMLQLLWYFLFL